LDALLTISSGGAEAGVMSSIRCENMSSAVCPHIDRVSAVDIVVDFAWMCLIPEGFRRRAVVLLVSFLAVFRALSHSPNSPAIS
jgi:hypothetical protein